MIDITMNDHLYAAEQDAIDAVLRALPPGSSSEVLVGALVDAVSETMFGEQQLVVQTIVESLPEHADAILAAYDRALGLQPRTA